MDAPRKFRIWAEVSGGVTGHRQAWLKDAEDMVKEFDTREEAQREARKLTKAMNDRRGGYATAVFTYSVREA